MAALAFSPSSCRRLSSSFSLSRFLFACSLTALSYAFCSAVGLTAFIPRAPAINLLATASVFSGRLRSAASKSLPDKLGEGLFAGGQEPPVLLL